MTTEKKKRSLTDSQRRALVYLSTRDHATTSRDLLASSAESLVDRGLVERFFTSRFVTSYSTAFYRITDAGRLALVSDQKE